MLGRRDDGRQRSLATAVREEFIMHSEAYGGTKQQPGHVPPWHMWHAPGASGGHVPPWAHAGHVPPWPHAGDMPPWAHVLHAAHAGIPTGPSGHSTEDSHGHRPHAAAHGEPRDDLRGLLAQLRRSIDDMERHLDAGDE